MQVVDVAGFEAAMAEAREKSKAGGKKSAVSCTKYLHLRACVRCAGDCTAAL